MSESVPDIINQKENIDTIPKVEHVIFGNNNVLIRTVFPRENDTAVCFVLVTSPISEKGMLNAEEIISGANESSKSDLQDFLTSLNTPIVFKGIDKAQEWFNLVKNTLETLERKKIATFIGIEDIEN